MSRRVHGYVINNISRRERPFEEARVEVADLQLLRRIALWRPAALFSSGYAPFIAGKPINRIGVFRA